MRKQEVLGAKMGILVSQAASRMWSCMFDEHNSGEAGRCVACLWTASSVSLRNLFLLLNLILSLLSRSKVPQQSKR